jgi:pyruvate/2-oxoglutarate dehydrogenase complex dihydrolipoamide acyltransferase (E2) component
VLVKASVDIEASVDGKLTQILVNAGDSFLPGQVLAVFEPD